MKASVVLWISLSIVFTTAFSQDSAVTFASPAGQKIIHLLNQARLELPLSVGFKMVTSDVNTGGVKTPTNWRWGEMTFSWQYDRPIIVEYGANTGLWNSGNSSFHNEIKTIAYNGEYWIDLVKAQGGFGNEIVAPRAIISRECPKSFDSPRWGTPEQFFPTTASLWSGGQTISGYLSRNPEWNITTTSDGLMVIEVSDKHAEPRSSILIEIEVKINSIKLRKIERKFGLHKPPHERLSIIDEVSSFHEVLGCYLPAHAKHTVTKGGQILTIAEFELYNPRLRTENASDIFDIFLPPGTVVFDSRLNTNITVGSIEKRLNLDTEAGTR